MHRAGLAEAQAALAQTQQARLAQLMAPVDGTVQQVAVHTEGGVVTPAQVLMVIVPKDAQVTAEVVVRVEDDDSDQLVTIDGQIGTTFGRLQRLTVRRAGRVVLLVRFPEMTFFERMRRKLGWSAGGGDSR